MQSLTSDFKTKNLGHYLLHGLAAAPLLTQNSLVLCVTGRISCVYSCTHLHTSTLFCPNAAVSDSAVLWIF